MTENKKLKQAVRARMEATGEKYTVALREVQRQQLEQQADEDASE
jgi:hypothetical protein